MKDDLFIIFSTLFLVCIPALSLVVWIFTFPAFWKRLKEAKENSTLKLTEVLKYAFSPLLVFSIGIFEALYALFGKFSYFVLFLTFPVWGPVLFLFLLWLILPEVLSRLVKNFGVWGEALLRFIEGFPERLRRRSAASLNRVMNIVSIMLTNPPLNRLAASQKSIHGLELMGFSPSAFSILKSTTIDASKNLDVRREAVRSLRSMVRKDDLMDILQDPAVDPKIAFMIAYWFKKNGYNREVLRTWRFLVHHVDASMRLKAAKKLYLEGKTAEARRAFMSLAQDRSASEEIRIQAVHWLGKLSQAFGEAVNIEQFQEPPYPISLRIASAEVQACQEPTEENLAKFMRYLDTEQPLSVHRNIIRALKRLKRRSDLRVIGKNPKLPAEARLEACRALQECGFDLSALICLFHLLYDKALPDPIRVQAAKELGRLGSRRVNFQDVSSSAEKRLHEQLIRLARNEEASGSLRLALAETVEAWGFPVDADWIRLLLVNSDKVDKEIRRRAMESRKHTRQSV